MSGISEFPRIEISLLYKATDQSFRHALKNGFPDITTAQELVLRILRFHGDMYQTELAMHTGQDRNNLSRTISILIKKNFVQKKNLPADKRYQLVSITSKGLNTHEKIFAIMEKWRKEIFFKDISLEELVAFNETFKKLIANLKYNN